MSEKVNKFPELVEGDIAEAQIGELDDWFEETLANRDRSYNIGRVR